MDAIWLWPAGLGAVDTGSTPSVQYTYSDPSTGSLLTSMVYPNGRTINYNYGDTGGVLMNNNNAMLDQAIGRLDGIVDGANSGDAGTVLEQYSYLGLSTIVARNHPQTGINLTLVGTSGSIGSGGDQYVGLDRFGRVVNQNWVNTSTGQSTDNFTYSYDANSNVTAKNNLLNTAYSETYAYDQLNRLTAVTRGGASYQSWGLDAQGNWSSFTSNGSTQTRTANGQNQITSISGTAATPTYDANGDMTTDQNGDTLVYDAWNRLVEVKNASGQVVAQYTYDARGYRVTESYPIGGNGVAPATTNYIYYDSSWQAIEVRTNGTAASNVASQTVWSAAYINAPVLQDPYVAGVLVPDSRLYFQQDANWNTTAVVGYDATTGTWGVLQRYVYSPYGNLLILNADFSTPPAGTMAMVNNLYQGMSLDPITGLYYERARWYSPSLGMWISQDPLQYINGANTYQFVGSDPVEAVDPGGLSPAATAVIAAAALPQGQTLTEAEAQTQAGPDWVVEGVPSMVPPGWTEAGTSVATQNGGGIQTWTETFQRSYVVPVENRYPHCDPATGKMVYDVGVKIVYQKDTVTLSRQNNQVFNTDIGSAVGLGIGIAGFVFGGPLGGGISILVGVGAGTALTYFLPPYGPVQASGGAISVSSGPVDVDGQTPQPP